MRQVVEGAEKEKAVILIGVFLQVVRKFALFLSLVQENTPNLRVSNVRWRFIQT